MKLRIFYFTYLEIWNFEESQIKNISINKQRKCYYYTNHPCNQPSQRMFLFFKKPVIGI